LLGWTVVDLGTKLSTAFAAVHASAPHVDELDIAVVSKLVINPQFERHCLATAATWPGVALLDDIKPIIGTIQQEIIPLALLTFCDTDSFILQHARLKLPTPAAWTFELNTFCALHSWNPSRPVDC
jgi:hypothetical protein